MKVHMLGTCETCRKALKMLRESGVEPQVIDVRGAGVRRETLARFLDAFGESLVNRRSATWRRMTGAQRDRSALEQLLDHPTLMKRPVIETDDGRLFLGWDSDVQAAVLPPAG